MMGRISRPCSALTEVTMPDLVPTPYAQRAQTHWETYLPVEYERIPPDRRPAFFADLGREIEERILAREQQLARREPEGGSYLGELARLTSLRAEAEQLVLAEMLPEPAEDDPAR
jgi:hypothetical protein